ncbi:MAG: hypothetical protein FWD94_04070 [Treponema sp.]|nr:hypothetical protein [Treponema sp.]
MSKTIGTNNESSLHRQLKTSYAGSGGLTEVELSGFVADAVGPDGQRIEIQIGSFAPLKKKAGELAAHGTLKIVYPVIVAKHLEFFDSQGGPLGSRKSNRSGKIWDLFNGMVHAPELPLVPGLEIELALVEVAERRIRDGKGSWRRRGVSVGDRRLLKLHERILLKRPRDYVRFVPFAKKEEFTSGELSEKAGIRVELARKTLYVLVRLGVVEKTGKRGKANLFRLLAGPRTVNWKKLP